MDSDQEGSLSSTIEIDECYYEEIVQRNIKEMLARDKQSDCELINTTRSIDRGSSDRGLIDAEPADDEGSDDAGPVNQEEEKEKEEKEEGSDDLKLVDERLKNIKKLHDDFSAELIAHVCPHKDGTRNQKPRTAKKMNCLPCQARKFLNQLEIQLTPKLPTKTDAEAAPTTTTEAGTLNQTT